MGKLQQTSNPTKIKEDRATMIKWSVHKRLHWRLFGHKGHWFAYASQAGRSPVQLRHVWPFQSEWCWLGKMSVFAWRTEQILHQEPNDVRNSTCTSARYMGGQPQGMTSYLEVPIPGEIRFFFIPCRFTLVHGTLTNCNMRTVHNQMCCFFYYFYQEVCLSCPPCTKQPAQAINILFDPPTSLFEETMA